VGVAPIELEWDLYGCLDIITADILFALIIDISKQWSVVCFFECI
jgi:hypothetical protein